MKNIKKATKPLATNDVIVNTSGIQRMKILRRHNTDSLLTENLSTNQIERSHVTINCPPNLSTMYDKNAKNRDKKRKQGAARPRARYKTPISQVNKEADPVSAENEEINEIISQKLSLFEPPIWLLAEEDFHDESHGSNSYFHFPNSNRSSACPSPGPKTSQDR